MTFMAAIFSDCQHWGLGHGTLEKAAAALNHFAALCGQPPLAAAAGAGMLLRKRKLLVSHRPLQRDGFTLEELARVISVGPPQPAAQFAMANPTLVQRCARYADSSKLRPESSMSKCGVWLLNAYCIPSSR
jgi:hypothetical protein